MKQLYFLLLLFLQYSCTNNKAANNSTTVLQDTIYIDTSKNAIDVSLESCLENSSNVETCFIENYEAWKDSTTTLYKKLIAAATPTETKQLSQINAAFEVQLNSLTEFIDAAAATGKASEREDRILFLAAAYKQYYYTLQQINNYITN